MTRTYKHMGKTNDISFPHLSDTDVVHRLRIFTRVDWNHEALVKAARDRILCLAQEKAALLEALELAHAALSGANMNMKVVEGKVRAAIAKEGGES